MRINTRLDPKSKEKLAFIMENSGNTISVVVKNAINCYYEVIRQDHRPGIILEKTGFIGCGERDANLSTLYKDDWRTSA